MLCYWAVGCFRDNTFSGTRTFFESYTGTLFSSTGKCTRSFQCALVCLADGLLDSNQRDIPLVFLLIQPGDFNGNRFGDKLNYSHQRAKFY